MGILKIKRGAKPNEYPLPVTTAEMHHRGWDEIDILIVTGDSYIDHPFMEASLVGRVLENAGFRVGILPQPDWQTPEAFTTLGKPKLFYLITAGNSDSMAANYTASRARQKEEIYSIKGAVGLRPDRASIVYSHRAREGGQGVPIVLFGLEASQRRLAHYDFWQDEVRRPILFDAKADMVIYGPPEKTVVELAQRVKEGEKVKEIKNLHGTAFRQKKISGDILELPGFESICRERKAFDESFSRYAENYFSPAPTLTVQKTGDWYLTLTPPPPPLETEAVDTFYDLPYTRKPHPLYEGEYIPIASILEQTIVAVRGCAAPTLVCPSAFHFRGMLEARSLDSIKKEAEKIASADNFTGSLFIVGGNAARKSGVLYDLEKELDGNWSFRKWARKEGHLVSQMELRETLETIEKVDSVYFYGIYNSELTQGLPSHSAEAINTSRLPFEAKKEKSKNPSELFLAFISCCEKQSLGRRSEPYFIPSLVVGRPGTETADAVELALLLRRRKQRVDKVFEFLPLPLSFATTRFFTGLDPLTGEPVYVPSRTAEKKIHGAILKHYEPENQERVRRALMAIRRRDLIGKGPEALVDYSASSPSGNRSERPADQRMSGQNKIPRKPALGPDNPRYPFRKRWE